MKKHSEQATRQQRFHECFFALFGEQNPNPLKAKKKRSVVL